MKQRQLNLLSYRMRGLDHPRFRISYWHGDECWRSSLHIDHVWFNGRYYWHILFLPW
jgi:hypothetical protein